MMNKLTGSELTRAMLARGDKDIWCAVCDESDERAMMDLYGNDFTVYIVAYRDGYFYCRSGTSWACAVPIKIAAITQEDQEYIDSPMIQ
ncbi:hypothetical protein NK638_02290 [Psychrobacter sp. A3]|uniref:hypothetical protein n=1 Tax=Psychrobacter sp. A3 TaxID=2992754 RepID=UPI00237B9D17|nr:hypothetical protein [Psychrobacter sp. A3]MDE0490384.1 hypothetical protein [Psychrobacter sp. A3]